MIPRYRLSDKQVAMLVAGEELYYYHDKIVASDAIREQLRTMSENAAAYLVEDKRSREPGFRIEIGLK